MNIAMAFLPLSSFLAILILTLHSPVSAEIILEEGYTVATVLDGNKLPTPIYPTRVLPRLGGTHDLLVLDSQGSVFLTVSFPISQDSEVKRFSGNGSAGFSDGGLDSAMFDRPKSFAVDTKGNVYVADKANNVIRKIGPSGVTTIAGGHSRKAGKVDGPAQDAAFSEDFELEFVPGICALLITDRGNRLIRQMNLKSDDCSSGSKSQFQMGLTSSAFFGVSCLILGLAIGCISSYLFLNSRDCISQPLLSETWKHSQIRLGRQVLILYSDLRSAIASSRIYCLTGTFVKMRTYQLRLMFSIPRGNQTWCRQPVNLFDSDYASNHQSRKPQNFSDQLKDLISFEDEDLNASEMTKETSKQGEKSSVLTNSYGGSIDSMIRANILDFSERAPQKLQPQESLRVSCGLVRRK